MCLRLCLRRVRLCMRGGRPLMKFKGPFRRFEDRMIRSSPIEPGLYAYQEGDQYGGKRFHLRVEPGGNSILSINASRMLHLNESATEYAKLILDGMDYDRVVGRMKSRYRVGEKTVKKDYEDLKEKIDLLGSDSKICPISYMGLERVKPFETPVSAPYRMDIALTYRCNNNCGHCYVERKRDFPEMTTEQWKEAIDKIWEMGIPHIVFTGGEATEREDLVELVEYAEDIGLVTGLLTNGRRLARDGLIDKLAEAGLDHVQITLESDDEATHDRMVNCAGAWKETVEGVRAADRSPVFVITNTTISAVNRDRIIKTVDFIHELGLQTFAMNGIIYTGGGKDPGQGVPEGEMAEILFEVQERAIKYGMNFIWYTPTRYCDLDPVALGLGPKQCTAAKYNMCIEPNGDIIPCQSYFKPAGNILRDDWESIWNAPVCVSIRNREFVDDECRECEAFPICGGGCPLAPEKGVVACFESRSTN